MEKKETESKPEGGIAVTGRTKVGNIKDERIKAFTARVSADVAT